MSARLHSAQSLLLIQKATVAPSMSPLLIKFKVEGMWSDGALLVTEMYLSSCTAKETFSLFLFTSGGGENYHKTEQQSKLLSSASRQVYPHVGNIFISSAAGSNATSILQAIGFLRKLDLLLNLPVSECFDKFGPTACTAVRNTQIFYTFPPSTILAPFNVIQLYTSSKLL